MPCAFGRSVAQKEKRGLMAEYLLRLVKAAKIYGRNLVFKNVSLEVAKGSAIIVTGGNGAGKSTLLRLMAGLARLSAGKIIPSQGLKTGYLGHATFLYPSLTALENLKFWSAGIGLRPSVQELIVCLEKWGLGKAAHQPCRHFSRGMAQKLAFIRAQMQKPDLLLLDEPFSGMDAQACALLRQEIQALKSGGMAIVFVSHNPAEDAQCADRSLVLKPGGLFRADPREKTEKIAMERPAC